MPNRHYKQEMPAVLGSVLKGIREEKGYSVRELAEKIPLETMTINLMEKDVNRPSGQVLEKISSVYGLDRETTLDLFRQLIYSNLCEYMPNDILQEILFGEQVKTKDDFIEKVKAFDSDSNLSLFKRISGADDFIKSLVCLKGDKDKAKKIIALIVDMINVSLN